MSQYIRVKIAIREAGSPHRFRGDCGINQEGIMKNKDDIEMYKSRCLAVLSRHIGKENAIGMGALYQRFS